MKLSPRLNPTFLTSDGRVNQIMPCCSCKNDRNAELSSVFLHCRARDIGKALVSKNSNAKALHSAATATNFKHTAALALHSSSRDLMPEQRGRLGLLYRTTVPDANSRAILLQTPENSQTGERNMRDFKTFHQSTKASSKALFRICLSATLDSVSIG